MTNQLLGILVGIMVLLSKVYAMQSSQQQLEKMMFSSAGLKLIERLEGFRGTIYNCPAGVPTIGYGHVVKALERDKFAKGIEPQDAELLLREDLNGVYVPGIKRKVTVALTQGQFDALTSFIYNLGEKNLGDSTLLRLLNDGKYDQAAHQFPRWCFAQKKYYPGLFKRRIAEMFIFQDHTNIPPELAKIQLGQTQESLLETYISLDDRLKEEAVEIYRAYKGN